jgi:hypothetical protein
MTDKELLELAAKAAEYDVKPHGNSRYSPDLLFTLKGKNWNPLTDDGDALRLAMKLQIDIEWWDGEVWAYRHASADDECFTAIEAADHDPKIIGTTTRRAITRAAAEIGKTK